MESFLVAVNAVIPFFCYLALGYTMKIRGVVKEEFLQKLNQMVFRVFYPFMTFYNIYKAASETIAFDFHGCKYPDRGSSPDRDHSEDRKGKPQKRRYHPGDFPKQLCSVRTAAHDRGIRRFSGIDRGYDGYGRCVDLQYHIGIYS